MFCDNLFTSVKLAEDLLQNNIYLRGTTRTNRKDFPRELAANNAEVKCLQQGELLFRILSTQSNPVENETVNRKQCDETIIQV